MSLCRAQGARLPSVGDGGRACGECGKGAGCRLGGPGATLSDRLLLPSRIVDPRFEKVAYFVFGDFNFRLDAKSVVEVGAPAPRGRVRAGSVPSFPPVVLKAKTPNKKMPHCRKGGRDWGHRGSAPLGRLQPVVGRPFYAPVPVT